MDLVLTTPQKDGAEIGEMVQSLLQVSHEITEIS